MTMIANYRKDGNGPLFGRFFLDSQFTAIKAAFGAYTVIERRCAAVGAGHDRTGTTAL